MISFKNATASGNGVTLLLTGLAQGATIVKSLEIVTGSESCVVHIARTDGTAINNASEISSASYADITVQMKANDYLILWEGFFVIPANHKLYFKSDSASCRCVVNYIEIEGTSSPSV